MCRKPRQVSLFCGAQGDKMKKVLIVAMFCAVCLAGCKSTVTHYDQNGKVTKVEETTNFARVMDGTNAKSQMVLVNGDYIGFEASPSAGENGTPGISVKYASGKIAVINEKDSGKFAGAKDVVQEFFASEVTVGVNGVTKK